MAERDEPREDSEGSTERLEPLLDAAMRRGFAARPASVETTWDQRDAEADLPREDLPVLPPRYRVSGELGRGGMGRVLRAADRVMGREVAIKVLHGTSGVDAARVERFWEEGRIASQLEHPAIVPIYDLGRTEDLEPYIAMKLVEGMTLREHLRADPAAEHDRQRRLGWFLQVCQAVAYAHARGVVHRDLKPENVMIGRFGEVHVMDWGLARIVAEGEDPAPRARAPHFPNAWQTVTGEAAGTPRYMAPEQARGERGRIGPPADVFALGIILSEVTTGMTTPAEVASQVPGAAVLSEIVSACLEEDPGRRIADAGILASRVSSWLESLEERAQKAELRALEFQVRADADRRHARVQLRYAAGIVVLVLLGGAAALAWDLGRRAQRASTERAVTETLDEAQALCVRAMAAAEEGERLRLWTEAAESARRALDVAVAGKGAPALSDRAAGVARDLEEAAEAAHTDALRARRERAVVARIREIQTIYIRQQDFEEERAAYVELLRTLDIDVASQSPAEVVRRIEGTGIADELRQGLEAWAVTYIGDQTEGSAACTTLRDVLGELDRDPFRRSLRAAAFERRAPELLELARSPEMLEAESGAALLMGGTLGYVHGAREAVAFYERMLTVDRGRSWYHLGAAFWSGKLDPPDDERSAVHYTAALALFPQSPVIRVVLARAEHLCGRHAHALELLDEATALQPELGMAYHNRGLALAELERHADAEASFREALERDPDNAATWQELSRIAERRGDLDEAISLMRRAIEINPEKASYHHDLGVCLRNVGQFEEARKQLLRAIELNPESAISHEALAATYADLGDHLAALDLYDRALSVDPDFATSHYSRGNALVRLGRFEEALKSFRSAIALDGENARFHVNLAQVLAVLGRFDEALGSFARVRELVDGGQETSAPVPLDELIRTCRGRGRNEERLRALFAGQHEPTDPREWASLARLCQFKRTSVEESRLWMRAFEIDATLTDVVARGWRYRGLAADAALRAGFGMGRDAELLDPAERRRWLEQGISWCRAELGWWCARLDRNDSDRDRERLARWAHREGIAHLLKPPDSPSPPADLTALRAELRGLLDLLRKTLGS